MKMVITTAYEERFSGVAKMKRPEKNTFSSERTLSLANIVAELLAAGIRRVKTETT